MQRRWTCALAVLLLSAAAQGNSDTPIVLTAESTLRVIVPDDASEQNRQAAARLVEHLHHVVGATQTDGDDADVTIHCGPTPAARAAVDDLDSFANDEFVITFPDAHTIVLVGGTDYGTEFAVCEFLERYAQVRWLFFGEHGAYIPQLDRIEIPRDTVRQKPAYQSRTLSGLEGDHYEFCYRNRMGGFRKREQGLFFEFHHNLGGLMHPVNYAKEHPEYYPLIHGERLIPVSLVGWQPCFSNPQVFATIAANVTQHFRSHPQQQYMSLGINDAEGFCECDACLAANGGAKTRANGRGDFSTIYYRFVNDVVARVSETFPDRGYGLLAYEGAGEPPSDFQLDPRVTPMITRDRMAWIDPEIKSADQARHAHWHQAVDNLGWYDYTGGQFWAVPRVYFHQMADVLRYGAAHGVTQYYSEAYPNQQLPVEGPKLYLQLKLLWNPDIDVDAALDEWCELAVGPQAAPALKQYYAHWEDFWTRRVLDTEWWRKWRGLTYLYYEDLGYLAGLSSEDVAICDALMDKVTRLAGPTPEHRKRAEVLVSAYHLIRGNAAYQIAYWENNRENVRWQREATPLVASTFDEGMDGWGFWKNDYTFTEPVWDESAGRSSGGAIGIDAEGERHNSTLTSSILLRAVPITPGQTYRITAWYRGDGLPDDAKAALVVRWQDSESRWVEFMGLASERALKLSDRWTPVTMIVQAPRDSEPAVALMRPMLVLKKSRYGRIWFDDVTIEPVHQP